MAQPTGAKTNRDLSSSDLIGSHSLTGPLDRMRVSIYSNLLALGVDRETLSRSCLTGCIQARACQVKGAVGIPSCMMASTDEQTIETFDGHFGPYGGRYIPETLMPAVEELTRVFTDAWADKTFRDRFDYFLRQYVGRPSPLYRADRLTEALY